MPNYLKERMNAIKFNFMKKAILMMRALCVVVLVVFSLVGCEEADIYTIDAPSDLQARIDSIAAAKAGNAGDTTFIDIATAIVGAEDYSSPWWTDFSDYFKVPTGKMLTLEFINHNGGSADNYRNWVLVVSNEVGDREGEGYSEYFALRADSAGWGNADFDAGLISHNYPDTDGDGDIWNDFRATMDGAHVTLQIDHSAAGYVFITGTAVGRNGIELVTTYNQPVSATADITVFLVADGSYFEMKKAYLLPSQVTAVEDVEPESIAIAGAPTAVEKGNENFWGNATATVTFADKSSTEVDSADLSFTVVPDIGTTGSKTVIVAYSKTKQGKFTQAVSTFYTLEVTPSVSSLAITNMPDKTTYTFPGPAVPILKFDPTGMVVTATYSDGTTGVVPNGDLQFEIPAGDGAQNAVVSYVGLTSTVTTTVPVTVMMGETNQVGASDFSSGWWTAFSNEYNVASGSSKTFKMNLYSTEANNWNAPVVILRKANLTEYAVVRIDNYGWLGAQNTGANLDELGWTLTNDWNFDELAGNLDDSYVEITVTNVGNGKANVRYDVTFANGETHFQLYEGITVDSSDLNAAITIDGSYVNITSVE